MESMQQVTMDVILLRWTKSKFLKVFRHLHKMLMLFDKTCSARYLGGRWGHRAEAAAFQVCAEVGMVWWRWSCHHTIWLLVHTCQYCDTSPSPYWIKEASHHIVFLMWIQHNVIQHKKQNEHLEKWNNEIILQCKINGSPNYWRTAFVQVWFWKCSQLTTHIFKCYINADNKQGLKLFPSLCWNLNKSCF